MRRITIDEIKTLFKLSIEKLEADRIVEIEINIDEYWIILADEWSNFKEEPKPAVGSLTEDIDYLKRAIKEGAMFSYSNFDRLASLLHAISEIKAPSNG